MASVDFVDLTTNRIADGCDDLGVDRATLAESELVAAVVV
jgi:hypothetical protein